MNGPNLGTQWKVSILTHIRSKIGGDGGRVLSIVDAPHFATVGSNVLKGYWNRRYTHILKQPSGCKIAAVELTVTGYTAGKLAFDNVFASARQIHAQRSLK